MKKLLLISLLLVGCNESNEERNKKVLEHSLNTVKITMPPGAYDIKQLDKYWYTFNVKIDKDRKFLLKYCPNSRGDSFSFVELQ